MHFRYCTPLQSVLVCHKSCTSRFCTNTHFSCESGFRRSGTSDLSLQCQCPSVVVIVGGRLWRDIFRLESECLATPSVLSASGGSQALDWPCRAIPLIVSCPIACEISDPCGSFEDLVDPLAPHIFERFLARPTVYWNNLVKLVAPVTRPNLSRSLAQAHARFFVLSSRRITLARLAVIAASTAYSTRCLFRVASVTTSAATSAAVLFLVPARISSITAAAMRSSADFPHSCDNVSTFSRSNWKSSKLRCCPS